MKKKNILIVLLLLLIISTKSVNAETLNCNNVYKKGNVNSNVKVLQRMLNQKSGCGLEVDGSFGPATESCVKTYQRNNGLQVDGIVGPQTCNKLNSGNTTSDTQSTNNTTQQNTTGTSTSLSCSNTLRRGSTGDSVSKLQKTLNEKVGCNLQVDGSFGIATESCVIAFQKSNGLQADGVVGPQTCNSLNGKSELKESVAPTISKNVFYVNASDVNIRKGPSTSSSILGKTKKGNKYEVISNSNGWSKIKYNNSYAYISSQFLTQTIIIVDISDQRLYAFKDSNNYLIANVVTGMLNRHDTPKGYYTLKVGNKTTNTDLRGTNDDGSKYKAHVNYWMPFNGGVGFHDAEGWRAKSEFNQVQYINDGSHGCVNMLNEDAKTLYNSINKDTLVLVRE